MKTTPLFRYLPQLPDDDLWGIAVRGAGRFHSRPGSPYPPIGHPADHDFKWDTGRVLQGFQIVYISQGSGRFETRKSRSRKVGAGDAMLIFPSTWHRYAPDLATGWIEHWLELDGQTINRILAAGLLDESNPVAAVRNPVEFAGYLDRAIALVLEAHSGSRPEAGALGHLSLAQLQSQHPKGKPVSPAAAAVAAAEKLLTSEIDNPTQMPEIARKLGLSYSYFRRTFRSRTGLSPKKYRHRMRLERARRLLGSTSESIEVIAFRVGFSSAFHLSTSFKREFGIPPSRWRKQFAELGSH